MFSNCSVVDKKMKNGERLLNYTTRIRTAHRLIYQVFYYYYTVRHGPKK